MLIDDFNRIATRVWHDKNLKSIGSKSHRVDRLRWFVSVYLFVLNEDAFGGWVCFVNYWFILQWTGFQNFCPSTVLTIFHNDVELDLCLFLTFMCAWGISKRR